MPRLQASRGAQYPVVAEFNWTFNNWVVDSVTGVKETFGSTVANSTDPSEPGLTGPAAGTIIFDAIPLPIGAVVTGGELIVETAGAGPTAFTASVGIAGNTTGLLGATSLLAAGRTALLLTSPLICNSGQNVRLTVAYTVANATAGRFRLRIQYTLDGKVNEVSAI